jgi:hypothetical protein
MMDLQKLLLEFISFSCVTEPSNVEPKRKPIKNEQFLRYMQSVEVRQHTEHEMLWFGVLADQVTCSKQCGQMEFLHTAACSMKELMAHKYGMIIGRGNPKYSP